MIYSPVKSRGLTHCMASANIRVWTIDFRPIFCPVGWGSTDTYSRFDTNLKISLLYTWFVENKEKEE